MQNEQLPFLDVLKRRFWNFPGRASVNARPDIERIPIQSITPAAGFRPAVPAVVDLDVSPMTCQRFEGGKIFMVLKSKGSSLV